MGFYDNEWKISKEDCEDTMQYDVLENEDYAKYIGYLTDHDKDLLIDYAFKLFGNSANYKNIEQDMLILANRVNTYRSRKIDAMIEDSLYQDYPKKQSHKRKDEWAKPFRKQIEAMYELMGGDCIGTKEGNELKKALRAAHEAPEKYFAQKVTIYRNKDKLIKEYLTSLKIEGNSKARKAFMEALED